MKQFTLFGYVIIVGKKNILTQVAEIHPGIYEWSKLNVHIWMDQELKGNMRAIGITPVLKGGEQAMAEELVEELRDTYRKYEFDIEREMNTLYPGLVIRPRLK